MRFRNAVGRTLRRFLVGGGLLPLFLAGVSALHGEDNPPGSVGRQSVKIGDRIDDWSAADFRGKERTAKEFESKRLLVIVFLGTECPLAKLYGPRLQQLSDRHAEAGVQIIGVNSNRQDSLTDIAAYCRRQQIRFPVLKDTANRIADQFGALRTPEAFVLDEQRRIRYHGRIDDQYGVGYTRDKPQVHDLERAVIELLDDRKVSVPTTTAVGCFIGRIATPDQDSDVTYTKDIAGILRKHCVECHRPGEIAPFSLTDYDEVVGWAETIREVVDNGRMPPWHADPRYGEFHNARGLNEKEKRLIKRWVTNGAPQGSGADQNDLPEPPASRWHLPKKPDVVIPMRKREFRVAAEGTVDYQYFVVDPQFTEDKWVTACEVIPGNRRVVHHVLIFIRPPAATRRQGLGWIGGYVPGQEAAILPPGLARRVPAGSKFVFQMHYTPVGSVQTDLTKLGLLFADPAEVTEEVLTLMAIDREFEIPPHAKDYAIEKTISDFPKGRLLGITPHMHSRGKSFRFELEQTDGPRTLLSVPNYDFNWQHSYEFKQPLAVGPQTRIRCQARYDNSAGNLVNPDPTVTVRWGDQTWEEMFLAFFEVAVPRGSVESRENAVERKQRLEKRVARAKRFLKRFDQDGDGRVVRSEVPDAIRTFAFTRMDVDRDGTITEREALAFAAKSELETEDR